MTKRSLNNKFMKFENYIKEKMKKNDCSHDIIHVKNVVEIIKKIIQHQQLSIYMNACIAAIVTGYAHEICDRKYCTDLFSNLKELNKQVTEIFGTEIAHIVTKVVPLISFTRRIQFGIPQELTEEEAFAYFIVSDADMLEAMGAIGVIRTYMYGCHVNRSTESAQAYIENELSKCNELLHFEWSKLEGSARKHTMQIICEQIHKERVFL